MGHDRLYRFLPLLGLLLCGVPSARAAVYRVDPRAPSPTADGASWLTAFRTITPALQVARPGDEVWVAGGRYGEHLVIYKPGLALYGGFEGDETERVEASTRYSFIEGGTNSSPIVTVAPEASGARLNGFMLSYNRLAPGIVIRATDVLFERGGVDRCGAFGGEGGGIVCEAGSSATIRDCTIGSNRAKDGAGLLARGATVAVRDCYFSFNDAGDVAGGRMDYRLAASGGGICITDGSAEITGNTFYTNTARDGAAVWGRNARLSVARNTFTFNKAEREAVDVAQKPVYSFGGALGLESGRAEIRNNVFEYNSVFAQAPLTTRNRAIAKGGAVWLGESVPTSYANVINNTFAFNRVAASGINVYPDYSGEDGSALYLGQGGVVANCIFHGNLGPRAVASMYPLHLTHSLFSTSRDTGGNYVPAGTNFTADPLFASYGYRLSAASPAVDRGETSFLLSSETDRDGAPRVQGARVDIGAFEFAAPPAPARVYVSPEGNDAYDGKSWGASKATVQAAVDAVALDGEVWVARGRYTGGLLMRSRLSLYGGFTRTESRREERVPHDNPSILDGNGEARVVFIAAATERATLDGFTIRNGRVTWPTPRAAGAGIYCEGREITIVGNIIEGNTVEFYEDDPSARGGGLSVHGGSITLANNVFRNNLARAVQGMTYPNFSSYASAHGGGADITGAEVVVDNNVFDGNRVEVAGFPTPWDVAGSGLVLGDVTGRVTGNTFVRNGPTTTYALKSATLHISTGPKPLIVANNILAFNDRGIAVDVTSSAVTLEHNDVFGNPSGNYITIEDQTGRNGNISADPLFVNLATGDLRLRRGSPAVDAGNNAHAHGPTDVAGQPRIQGQAVDMGAYETAPPAGYTLADAKRALGAAAGLWTLAPDDAARLNVTEADGAPGTVTLADAAAIVFLATP